MLPSFNKEAISYADVFLKLRLKMHYPGDAQAFVMATLCPDEYKNVALSICKEYEFLKSPVGTPEVRIDCLC